MSHAGLAWARVRPSLWQLDDASRRQQTGWPDLLGERLSLTLARDGLPARQNGEYARRKLQWLDRYLPAALTATVTKHRRVYVDLFAGPGVNKDGETEFKSGALRALRALGKGELEPAFTDAVLVNIEPADHEALVRRIDRLCAGGGCRVPRDHIVIELGDANELIPAITQRFDPLDYLLVFADIEGPTDLPWTSVEALKRAGHQSVDLYVLFPLEMAISRMIAYDRDRQFQFEHQLTAFFGTDAWKDIAAATRVTDSRAPEFRRRITDLYCRQLETLWEEAGSVLEVKLRGDQGLYRMLFAASHEAASKISQAVGRLLADTGQLPLFPS